MAPQTASGTDEGLVGSGSVDAAAAAPAPAAVAVAAAVVAGIALTKLLRDFGDIAAQAASGKDAGLGGSGSDVLTTTLNEEGMPARPLPEAVLGPPVHEEAEPRLE